MIYITKEYLITYQQERFINESSEWNDAVLQELEKSQIAKMISLLNNNYDTELIFNPENPIINEYLKEILCKMVLYQNVRRNAARKVPMDYKEEYDWAIKELKDLNQGKIILNDLPKPKDDNGNIISQSFFGTTTNKDYYI